MTSHEAAKAPCPYRIRQIVGEPGPGGRTCASWRIGWPGDMPRLCAGTGMLDECMRAHNVTDCDKCPDREGYCR